MAGMGGAQASGAGKGATKKVSGSGDPTQEIVRAQAAGTPAPKAATQVSAPAPKPIATPQLADNSGAASTKYWADLAAGQAYADDKFKDGSMGRITDPRQKEMNELLARQKSGLDGLTSEENRAMTERSTADINRQMAQNSEAYASKAGAAGVRGGAAASLQARAGMQAQQQYNDFQNQLILDNVAIKQQAMDRYGSTLGAQQNTELGINQYNNGQANAELYGRTSMPFQIASGIQATEAGLDAKGLSQQQLGLSTNQVNATTAQTAADSARATTDNNNAKTAQKNAELMANKTGKIICTEAFRQGLITEEKWQVTQRYRKLLTMREYKGYIYWATPVVARMRADHSFARKLIPFVSRMIEAERFALGELSELTAGQRAVAVLVKVLNYGSAAIRSLSLRFGQVSRGC